MKQANNLWSQIYQVVRENCTGLTSSNIQKCELDGADFTGAAFKRCNFEKSSVAGAKWLRTVFKHTQLAGMTFDGGITDCAFEGVKPSRRVVFQNVTLRNTFFKNCKLRKLVFENCRADSLTIAFLKNCGGMSKASRSGRINRYILTKSKIMLGGGFNKPKEFCDFFVDH